MGKYTCHLSKKAIAPCTFNRPGIENCPMRIAPEILEKAKKIYEEVDEIKEITKNASIVEATGYIRWPRLKDTIEFAKLQGYKKLGIAFCVGLMNETKKVVEILERYDFDVTSICCKTGGLLKTEVGVPKEFKMKSKTGYMIGAVTCNPVAQALLLNDAGTEMNIICGLCVGHDITFTKYSEAPVTTLIAKDRMTQHAPSSILFTQYGDSFFSEDLRGRKTKK